VKYFFDNCISYRFAGMLAALGVDAVALRHEFSESIRDVALFEALSGSAFGIGSATIRECGRMTGMFRTFGSCKSWQSTSRS
jgi:hypothetical protein